MKQICVLAVLLLPVAVLAARVDRASADPGRIRGIGETPPIQSPEECDGREANGCLGHPRHPEVRKGAREYDGATYAQA